MDDQAERIAEPQGVYLRPVGRLAHERIVRRRGPIVVEAQDLAGVTAGILRLLGRADAIAAAVRLVTQRHADRHEDPAVGGKHQPGDAEAGDPDVRHEDIFDVGQGVPPVESAAPEHLRPRHALIPARIRRHVRLVGIRFQVREVDEPVFGKPGMHGRVPQAPPAAVTPVHLRHAADRLRVEHAVAHDPQVAGSLGDEDVAVRQEVHGRRAEEALDRHHAEALVAEARDLRLVGQRVGSNPAASLLRVADGDEEAHRENDEPHGRLSRRACAGHGDPLLVNR